MEVLLFICFDFVGFPENLFKVAVGSAANVAQMTDLLKNALHFWHPENLGFSWFPVRDIPLVGCRRYFQKPHMSEIFNFRSPRKSLIFVELTATTFSGKPISLCACQRNCGRGYYPDAIIAMLQAYANTNSQKYLVAAQHLTLNYLQAANFDGTIFKVPPGKSFKWVPDSQGIPRAQCTSNCYPVSWDYADASRALGMCQANYYAKGMGVALPGLQKYCDLWGSRYMTNPGSAPIQYNPDGSAVNYQSGYFAQGLQSLFASGYSAVLYRQSLDSALSHYTTSTKTFDYAPSFGVYMQAFAIRSLGMGIGRDAESFRPGYSVPQNLSTAQISPTSSLSTSTVQTSSSTGIVQTPTANASAKISVSSLSKSCSYGSNSAQCAIKSDITSGTCRTIIFSTASGDIKIQVCDKGNGYFEVYRQSYPSGLSFKACTSTGCVDKYAGFAKFQAYSLTDSGTSTALQDSGATSTTSSTSTTSAIPAPTASAGVSSLAVSVLPSGTKLSDYMEGSTCRRVKYRTLLGDIEAKICQKSSNKYEMYQLTKPNSASICVSTNCVGPNSGFSAFSYP